MSETLVVFALRDNKQPIMRFIIWGRWVPYAFININPIYGSLGMVFTMESPPFRSMLQQSQSGAWHVASHSWAVRSRGALHATWRDRGLARSCK